SGYLATVGGDALRTLSYVRTTIATIERLVTTRNKDPRYALSLDLLESNVYEWIRPDSVANRILNRRHKPISLLETKDVQPFDSMIVSYAYEDVAIVRIRKRGYCSEKSFTISSISFELDF